MLIAPKNAFNPRGLPQPPLLAVEVLSPSTRRIDLTLKKARYEAAGCQSYWVVDPADKSITIWELHDGHYAEITHATGSDPVAISQPSPATIHPSALFEYPTGHTVRAWRASAYAERPPRCHPLLALFTGARLVAADLHVSARNPFLVGFPRPGGEQIPVVVCA